MPRFDHEKLEVYQLGIEFVVLADGLGRLARGRELLVSVFSMLTKMARSDCKSAHAQP